MVERPEPAAIVAESAFHTVLCGILAVRQSDAASAGWQTTDERIRSKRRGMQAVGVLDDGINCTSESDPSGRPCKIERTAPERATRACLFSRSGNRKEVTMRLCAGQSSKTAFAYRLQDRTVVRDQFFSMALP